MKSCGQCLGCRLDSRSRKGAWIEIVDYPENDYEEFCRSRKGAWIEIPTRGANWPNGKVAPVRERGLKLVNSYASAAVYRRSRKGAWIEITVPSPIIAAVSGRSRKGAWIEIS